MSHYNIAVTRETELRFHELMRRFHDYELALDGRGGWTWTDLKAVAAVAVAAAAAAAAAAAGGT